MKKLLSYLILLLLVACSETNNYDRSKKAEKQILSTEADFEKAVKEKGIKVAFLEYADDSAVINRSTKIFLGKKGIEEFFNTQTRKTISLNWVPDFMEASSSGDLGFTYGKYKFSGEDSTGKKIEFEGIFHTVWKKQKDGRWKFVYD